MQQLLLHLLLLALNVFAFFVVVMLNDSVTYKNVVEHIDEKDCT
jgi:hypothetical protein